MLRPGHLGTSMLVYSPVGAALAIAGDVELAIVAGAVMLFLAMLPDVDVRLSLIRHRGPTHSLLFAGLVGVALGWVGTAVGPQTALTTSLGAGVVGFGVGFLAVAAHLLADTLTPAGVNYFWPLSTRTYSVSICRAGNSIANYALLVLGGATLLGTAAALVRAGIL